MRAKLQGELALPQPAAPDSREIRERGLRVWGESLLPIFKAAVERLTPKEAAFLFDVRGTYLSDALEQRASKGPRLQWLVFLLIAAPEAARLELLTELCRIAGYMAPERRREISDAEELRRYKRIVKRDYPGAVAAIEREVEES